MGKDKDTKMKKPCRQGVRDNKGRFVKGVSGNPKGSNQFTSLVPLINALKKAGKKRGEDFWDMVANRTWQHESVLIAILRKVLPDQLDLSGEMTVKVVNKIPR